MSTETAVNRTKGAEFITKETNCNNVFSLEDVSDDQKMIMESAKDFMKKEIEPKKADFEKRDFPLVEASMKKVGDLGLLGISVPEAYGGSNLGFVTTMIACDIISGVSGSLATAYGAHTGIGTMPITLYGTEAQKQKYLPLLASGEMFGSYALTEPDAGSDANSGKTKAVLNAEGTHYLITGQKMWITNSGFAGVFIVFARIEDDKNITGFIVDRAMNGITFGEEEHKLGIRSSSTRQVFFNETKVPVENILGERNNGFKIAINALNIGRIKLAAACLDAQRNVTDTAVKYANERKQFNTPISSFGAIQQKIAEMATRAYVSESGSYRAAKDIEDAIHEYEVSGLSHQEAELKGVEEYSVECSILKVYASEAIQMSTDEGIQIYGGMGFSEEAPMESAWRDARIARIYEGTNEINRLLSVGMVLKKAFKGEIDFMGAATAVGKEVMGVPSFEKPDFSALLSEEKSIIEGFKKVFLMITGNAAQKYMMELEKEQQLLMFAADILTEVYMAESTILRVEKLVAKSSEESYKVQLAIARLNLFNASQKVINKATEAIISFTEGDEQKLMLSGLKRFVKYSSYPNIIKLKEVIAGDLIAKNGYSI